MKNRTMKGVACTVPLVLVVGTLLTRETTTAPKTVQHDPPHTQHETMNYPGRQHNRGTVVGSTATVTGTSFGFSGFIPQTPPA